MNEDDLTLLIAEEANRINTDFERHGGSPTTFILAITSMVMGVHAALDHCRNPPDLDKFSRDFVDEALANVLRERGWTVLRPEALN